MSPMQQATNHKSRNVIAKPFFIQKGKCEAISKYVFIWYILPSRIKIELAGSTLLFGRFPFIHSIRFMKRRAVLTRHAIKGCGNLSN